MTQKHLPKQCSPGTDRDRVASAPYNFVPLPNDVITAVAHADDLPDHDCYLPGRHTGYFQVTLTTKSPLYIRCPLSLEEFLQQERKEDEDKPFKQQVKNTPHFFYTRDPDKPVIPGSSLRGMLRSLVEIVGYGKMQWVTDAIKIYYRAVAAPKDDPLGIPYKNIIGNFGKNVRAGYLTSKGNEWYIKPSKKPTNMGWPEQGAYLKVKDSDIPEGAIPGFLRFNSPKYKPQYHAVSFEVEEHKGKKGNFIRIKRIGAPEVGYKQRGFIVCSGNMLETADTKDRSPRSRYALVLEEDPKAKLLKISSNAVTDYVEALTPFQTEPPFDSGKGCLINGCPVFYIERDGEVLFFGHCPNFRLPALIEGRKKASIPLDFTPFQLRRPEDIDFAEGIFGFVRTDKDDIEDMVKRGSITKKPRQGEKGRAYGSRVFVTDAALLKGQTDIWLSDDPIVPKILASPKPTAFQHYLVQTNDNKDKLKHYGSKTPEDTVIRGHKCYWHQGLSPERGLAIEQIRAAIAEKQEILIKIKEQEEQGKPEKQHTQFKPVKPGVKFQFRLYFENLSDEELGALCWVLNPLGDASKDYCHHLGMGKPLGMGAVKLEAALYRTDRAKRYSALFDGDGWQEGLCGDPKHLDDSETLIQLTCCFEEYVLGDLDLSGRCKHLSELERIAMLLKIMEWPGYPAASGEALFLRNENRPNTRYMTIQPNEYTNRPVLPDPSAFGSLNGNTRPSPAQKTATSSPSEGVSVKTTSFISSLPIRN